SELEYFEVVINPEPTMVPGIAELCSDVASGIIVGPDAGSAIITEYELKGINKPGGLTAGGDNAGLGIHPANLAGGESDFLSDDTFTNTTSNTLTVIYTIAPIAS